jgi:TonB-dependent SusC/RagA subfamily outer membrane receptor
MRDVTIAEAANGGYVRVTPEPGASGMPRVVADNVAGAHVFKAAPGRILQDRTDAIWIRLKPAGTATADAAKALMRTPAPDGARRARVALRGGTVTIQPTDSARRAGVGPTTLSVRPPGDTTGPKPLYVLDGVEIDGTSASLPKPDRIDAISVLKGAAAIREYGDRAANGAIVITTKRN